MSVPLTLLGLLEREPSHGYELKRDYDMFFARGKPLSYGQVYGTLSRLAEHGEGPERRRYVITEQGVAEVEKWLAEPIPPEPHLQSELFAKVVLALMLDRPATRYLDAQRGAHLRRMHELTALKEDGKVIDILLADYGLHHLEADLLWIDDTAARLDTLAQAVRQ
jgi:DNA-binding PadR family transcriptional regulator